jgi:peptide/nickel transport system ATP-binding protein|tara:strand:+ start:3563 stop:5194 length:1632 start_codon:yes stop_codon:yes gene_type:complete
MKPLVAIRELETQFGDGERATQAVRGISFELFPGETYCLVGESGSGKSVTGLSMVGLLPDLANHPAGSVTFYPDVEENDPPLSILDAEAAVLEKIRGSKISMIFQEPMTALNPVQTIGEQLMETMYLHLGLEGEAARQNAVDLLTQVELPDPEIRILDYPHRLSGGQRQRVMIAMALACEPDLLIADEPTTALDVTIQAQILKLLKKLQQDRNTTLLFITHDLSVVAQIADRVGVMQQGQLVEQGAKSEVLYDPQHTYTKELIDSLPQKLERLSSTSMAGAEPLLNVEHLKVYFPIRKGLLQRHVDDVKAVDDVSLKIYPGRAMAVVGESGSGKTTLGRAILSLVQTTEGSVVYQGHDLTKLTREEIKPLRRDLQIVFQDPQSSLNPRLTISTILTEPMKAHSIGSNSDDRIKLARQTLKQVGLDPAMLSRFPHEFSGGQRQRIGIARALVLNPKFIVCDEVTSALDVRVQAQILKLLDELRNQFDLTYLFISHNIEVVRYFCDDISVMHQGKIVEFGRANEVCDNPNHAYTRRLIEAVPKFD